MWSRFGVLCGSLFTLTPFSRVIGYWRKHLNPYVSLPDGKGWAVWGGDKLSISEELWIKTGCGEPAGSWSRRQPRLKWENGCMRRPREKHSTLISQWGWDQSTHIIHFKNTTKIPKRFLKKCILVIFIRTNKQKHRHCLLLLWILVRVKKPARSYCRMIIPEYILTPSSFCQPLERLPWRQGGKGWVSWHWAEFGNLQIIRRWRIL